MVFFLYIKVERPSDFGHSKPWQLKQEILVSCSKQQQSKH